MALKLSHQKCRVYGPFRAIKSSLASAASKATRIFRSIYRALNGTDAFEVNVCAHHRILLFRAEPIMPALILIYSTVILSALHPEVDCRAFEKTAKVNVTSAV